LWVVEFGELELVAEDEKFSFGWIKGQKISGHPGGDL
jgi:hypothetical protein